MFGDLGINHQMLGKNATISSLYPQSQMTNYAMFSSETVAVVFPGPSNYSLNLVGSWFF